VKWHQLNEPWTLVITVDRADGSRGRHETRAYFWGVDSQNKLCYMTANGVIWQYGEYFVVPNE